MIGSFSFLQVTRTTIKAWMSSDFGVIPPLVRRITGIILVNLDLRCIENVLTDYDSQHLQKSESS